MWEFIYVRRESDRMADAMAKDVRFIDSIISKISRSDFCRRVLSRFVVFMGGGGTPICFVLACFAKGFWERVLDCYSAFWRSFFGRYMPLFFYQYFFDFVLSSSWGWPGSPFFSFACALSGERRRHAGAT